MADAATGHAVLAHELGFGRGAAGGAGTRLCSIRARRMAANCLYTGTGSSGLIVTGKMVLIRQNVMITRLRS